MIAELFKTARRHGERMTRNVKASVALSVLVLVLGGLAVLLLIDTPASPIVTPDVSPSRPRIRVGVMVSDFSANGPSWSEGKYGYRAIDAIMPALIDPDLELIAVIEPGSESQADLQDVLGSWFGNQRPIDGSDPDALSQLDVILVCLGYNMRPEVLDGIEQAVSGGVGLVSYSHFGSITPGRTPQTARLAGLGPPTQHVYNSEEIECAVATEHPLLGRLSGKTDERIAIALSGPAGVFGEDVQPLLLPGNRSEVKAVTGPFRPEMSFSPLYISRLGSGRIVGISWYFWKRTPPQIQNAIDEPFIKHAVKWLAAAGPVSAPQQN